MQKTAQSNNVKVSKSSHSSKSNAESTSQNNDVLQKHSDNMGTQYWIQAKLSVSQPDDPYEKEADQVAEQIMRKPMSGGVGSPSITPIKTSVQRKCSSCEEQEQDTGIVQTKRDSSESRQAKATTTAMTSRGQPLSATVRHFFEPRFSYDFSKVRVHTDFAAQTNNRAMRAKAFTMGNNIAFNQGQYAPHTDAGKTLLAHELTHVVQQAGGRQSEPMLQANGGEITDEELAALHAYVNEQLIANPDPSTAIANPGTHSQLQWPLPGYGGTNALGNWHGLGNDHNNAVGPGLFPQQMDYLPPPQMTYSCPGTCHQIAQSHERYAQERMAAQEKRRRLERWSGMHVAQHQEELGKQPKTLKEDLNNSEMATMQLRIKLFGSAVGAGSSNINNDIRDKWVAANQATLFLDMLLRNKDSQVPDEMVAPLRQAYQDYFSVMIAGLQTRDRRDLQFQERFNRPDNPCPNCHDSTQPSFPNLKGFNQYESLFPEYSQPFQNLLPEPAQPYDTSLNDWVSELGEPEHVPGYREQRLGNASGVAASAKDHAMWGQVIGHFRWATDEMDQILMAAVPDDNETKKTLGQFKYSRGLLKRQRDFQQLHPNAVKVQAIFYPKPEKVDDLQQHKSETGNIEDYANGIPWQFYLTHSPVPAGEAIPANFEWYLHDITAAKRSNRTVKVKQTMSSIERSVRLAAMSSPQMNHPDSILKTDPDDSLFEELDNKDFFPEGHVYWQYPSFTDQGGVKSGDVKTTASRTFWEWVGLVGMSVAILGSLVFAPFSTPMLIAVAAGTGMSILGNYMRLQEMQEHGVATERDVNQFYWSLALDIMSALTLGMGRVVAGAAKVGNTARAATSSRYWFMLQRSELTMNAVNVGVVGYDFIQQYQAIEKSNMTPEQKREALQKLTMFGLLGGMLSLVPVATGVRDLRHGSTLHLGVDPQNPNRQLARFDADSAEDLQHFRSRPRDKNATPIGESIKGRNLNAQHSYRLWSDGRITRCSPLPCPDIAESIIERSGLLRTKMLTDSTHADALQDMAEQARRLHIDATNAANAPNGLASNMAELQRRTQELDDAMAALERNVMSESLASIRIHLSDPGELDKLLGRQLPDDILVDFGGVLGRVARAGDYAPDQLTRMVTVLRNMDEDTIRHLVNTQVQVNLNPNSTVFHMRDSIYWGRLRNSERVTMLEAQLRGYSPSMGATQRAPRTTTGTPGATLDEATAGGQHHITTLIGDPVPRQGFENIIPARGQIQDPDLKQSMDIMVSERLHAIGAGFGAESGTGIAHGSSFINQFLQNRGVEEMIRRLHANRPDNVRYIVHVDVRTRPVAAGETRMLDHITYRVRAVEELPNGGYQPIRDVFEATITHPHEIRAATRSRGKGDIQGIGIEVEAGYGQMAEFFGL